MKTEEFVAQIRQSVVEENTDIYRDLLESATDATDPYWIRVSTLYSTLDSDQKDTLLEIMRQVTIDSVSNLFAIIDGVTEVDGQDGPIRVDCGADEVSGELQDRFLEQFEE